MRVARMRTLLATLSLLLSFSSVLASQPCISLAIPEGVPVGAAARWRAVSGEDLGPATLEPNEQGWRACGAPSHAGPIFLDGDTWLSAPFVPGQQHPVTVFPAVTLRIPVPTPTEPKGRVWLTLAPEPPAPWAYRYPAAWQKDGVEARLPQGVWKAHLVFERWLPEELGVLSLLRNNPPSLPPVRLRPGRAVLLALEPMRGWEPEGVPWVWLGPATQVSDLWCAAAAGTLELVPEARPLEVGNQLLWGAPADDPAVLFWVKDKPALLFSLAPPPEALQPVRLPVGWTTLQVEVPELALFLRHPRHQAQVVVTPLLGDNALPCPLTVPFARTGRAEDLLLGYGTYQVELVLEALRQPFLAHRQTLEVATPVPQVILVHLTDGVSGRLSVGSEGPLDCLVSLNLRSTPEGGRAGGEAWTTPKGEFWIPGLKAGRGWARVRCVSPPVGGLVPGLRVEPGQVLEVTLGRGRLAGQLVTARGVPIAHRTIHALWVAPSPEEEAYESLKTVTDSRGQFRFENLAAGRWRVETQSPEGLTTVAWVNLEGAETRELLLREGATVRRVRIADTAGRPIPGAWGWLYAFPSRDEPGIFGNEVITDGEGSFLVPWSFEDVGTALLDLRLPDGTLWCATVTGDSPEVVFTVPWGSAPATITNAPAEGVSFPPLILENSTSRCVHDLFLHWASTQGRAVQWDPELDRLTLRLSPGLYALRRLPPGGVALPAIGALPVVATFAVVGDHPVEVTLQR